ncbi:MAG: hypothetical protein ACQSGP_24050 [Frankia sp.]
MPRPTPPEAAGRRSTPAETPRHGRRADAGPESTLRGLVGSGPSRVGPVAAMRARDVARPRPEDLERAEREVVIRRREGPPPGGGLPANRAAGDRAAGGRPTRGRRK